MGLLLGATVRAEQPALVVAEILGPRELRLADGSELRLAGIEIPRAEEQAAITALEELLGSERRVLVDLGAGRDRWGRRVAEAAIPGGGSLQDELVRRGLALAAPGGHRESLARLLALEAEARAAGRGAWTRPPGPVQAAERVVGPVGGFVLVEGVVLAVERARDHVYLNFGPDHRRDFTLRAALADARRWERQGFVLATLAGRAVRVRGWLMEAGGPMIELTTPDQVEVLP